MLLWIKAAHVLGVLLWAGGLLGLTRLLYAHGSGETPAPGGERLVAAERALYRTVCAPGLLLTLFTGIWMLHEQPALLKQPFMHIKLTAVALLFVVDHMAMRGPRKLAEGRAGGRRYGFLHGATLLLVATIAVLILVRPLAR